jgi:WD40 repeat protein
MSLIIGCLLMVSVGRTENINKLLEKNEIEKAKLLYVSSGEKMKNEYGRQIAQYYFARQQFDSAGVYYKKSGLENEYKLVVRLNGLQMIKQNKPIEALKCFQEIGYVEGAKHCLEIITEHFIKTENYDSAYSNLTRLGYGPDSSYIKIAESCEDYLRFDSAAIFYSKSGIEALAENARKMHSVWGEIKPGGIVKQIEMPVEISKNQVIKTKALFSADGKQIAILYVGATSMFFFDLNQLEKPIKLPYIFPLSDFDYSPDGNYAAVSSIDCAELLNLKNSPLIKKFDCNYIPPSIVKPIISLAFGANGKYLVTVHHRGNIFLWNLDNGEATELFNAVSNTKGIMFHDVDVSDESNVAITRNNNSEWIWDLNEKQVLFKIDNYFSDMKISPNGQYIIHLGSFQDRLNKKGMSVNIWDVTTQKQIKEFIFENKKFDHICISPDFKNFACADKDIYICSMDDGSIVHTLTGGHEVEITSISYNKTGRVLSSADRDGRVCIWKLFD